jgi:hypothetical protein
MPAILRLNELCIARLSGFVKQPIIYRSNHSSIINCLIETASKTLLLGFKDAVIPDDGSVTVIGRAAFAHTEGITGLIVPECVEEIGINAFYQCKDLGYLVIGSNVKTLGHDVLYQKEAICEVYYHGTAEQWETLKESTNGFYLNSFFASRPRYYYSETTPTEPGNYWHYVDGIPTPWKSEE